MQIAFLVVVRPWGVEPQSTEPESVILSIELRAHIAIFLIATGAKLVFFL